MGSDAHRCAVRVSASDSSIIRALRRSVTTVLYLVVWIDIQCSTWYNYRMNTEMELPRLIRWREEVQESLEKSRVRLAELQKQKKTLEEKLQLLDKLIALEDDDDEEALEETVSPDRFLDVCVEIMRANGEPMHISELHSKLLDSSVPIPGKGNQANVISRIQRSDGRVIRTGRGMYGLPEFGVSEQKPTRKERRAKSGKRTE